jgi:hypothetical protein
MEEVLAWFGDEKGRRSRLLADSSLQFGDHFPLSPARTTTPASSTVTMTRPHYVSSPGTAFADTLSPPPQYSHTGVPGEFFTGFEAFRADPATNASTAGPMTVTARARRGRPAKNHSQMSSESRFPDAKRQKCLTKYSCPDCDNILAADRWSEHVKRVHFPDQVWECPKINQRTRKPCDSKAFFRPDNFATHLRGEHGCGVEEISQLKTACKFRTKNLFHQVCGFCDDTFESRDESIEHIKNHFKEISERPNPPADFGASEWEEKCKSDHKLKRGVHYLVNGVSEDDNSDRDGDEEDDDDNSNQGNSDSQPRDHSSSQHDGHLPPNGTDSAGDNTGFYCYQNPGYMEHQHYSMTTAQDSPQKTTTDHPSPMNGLRNERVIEYQFPSPGSFGPQDGAISRQYTNLADGPVEYSQSMITPQFCTSPRRAAILSYQYCCGSDGNSARDETQEKGQCTYPECGKVFKDLKAHMLTHQNERPEKCPIRNCEYHVKGFARKYDKNRHTLTHYKGTLVCGFCSGSGSAAEKSFNRADVFKRHLTSVHGVEQTSPNNSRRKPSNSTKKTLSDYASDASAKCSTCDLDFSNAQDFYEHLDDCVLRVVQQEEPLEAVNTPRLVALEQDQSVHETLCSNQLPENSKLNGTVDEDVGEGMDGVDDFSLQSKSSQSGDPRGLTHPKEGVTVSSKVYKKHKIFPSSWGTPGSRMEMEKRGLCVFDGARRLWKDDVKHDTDCEVHMEVQDGRANITDLDIQTMRKPRPPVNWGEQSPWIVDDSTEGDLKDFVYVDGA